MKPIWRHKWRNHARKRVKSGLYARSSALTLRGEAILPSFGFGRFDHLLRRERLENEPHFLRFRSLPLVKTIQTKLTSFMSPYPSPVSSREVQLAVLLLSSHGSTMEPMP
ncbi:hypothetical protein [Roseibium sp. MMSF_3544]|uniref:hypothetical protein n=1 Tax=unclassified Roseibium TaxID=2629323 RepID=UPI00273D0152|nr:hypothetical protein [Roseibium sp. MMSF_3544]